jgi:hypothetical protein
MFGWLYVWLESQVSVVTSSFLWRQPIGFLVFLISSLAECERLLSVFNRLPTEGYTQGGKFWVRRRRDQELEGARNTKLRQVRAARCVTPYVLYGGLYCLLCRMT